MARLVVIARHLRAIVIVVTGIARRTTIIVGVVRLLLFYQLFSFAGFSERSAHVCLTGRSEELCNAHGVPLLLLARPANANFRSNG